MEWGAYERRRECSQTNLCVEQRQAKSPTTPKGRYGERDIRMLKSASQFSCLLEARPIGRRERQEHHQRILHC